MTYILVLLLLIVNNSVMGEVKWMDLKVKVSPSQIQRIIQIPGVDHIGYDYSQHILEVFSLYLYFIINHR